MAILKPYDDAIGWLEKSHPEFCNVVAEYKYRLDQRLRERGTRKAYARYLIDLARRQSLNGDEHQFLHDFIDHPNRKWKEGEINRNKLIRIFRNFCITVDYLYLTEKKAYSERKTRKILTEKYHIESLSIRRIAKKGLQNFTRNLSENSE